MRFNNQSNVVVTTALSTSTREENRYFISGRLAGRSENIKRYDRLAQTQSRLMDVGSNDQRAVRCAGFARSLADTLLVACRRRMQ